MIRQMNYFIFAMSEQQQCKINHSEKDPTSKTKTITKTKKNNNVSSQSSNNDSTRKPQLPIILNSNFYHLGLEQKQTQKSSQRVDKTILTEKILEKFELISEDEISLDHVHQNKDFILSLNKKLNVIGDLTTISGSYQDVSKQYDPKNRKVYSRQQEVSMDKNIFIWTSGAKRTSFFQSMLELQKMGKFIELSKHEESKHRKFLQKKESIKGDEQCEKLWRISFEKSILSNLQIEQGVKWHVKEMKQGCDGNDLLKSREKQIFRKYFDGPLSKDYEIELQSSINKFGGQLQAEVNNFEKIYSDANGNHNLIYLPSQINHNQNQIEHNLPQNQHTPIQDIESANLLSQNLKLTSTLGLDQNQKQIVSQPNLPILSGIVLPIQQQKYLHNQNNSSSHE